MSFAVAATASLRYTQPNARRWEMILARRVAERARLAIAKTSGRRLRQHFYATSEEYYLRTSANSISAARARIA